MSLVETHVVVRLGALVARLLLLLVGHLLVVPHLLGILASLLPVVPTLLLLAVLILLLLVVLILLLLVVPIPKGLQMAGLVGRISSWPFQRPSRRVALSWVP